MEFVCDYCGNVVSLKDKQCNLCGFIFSNIRCPNCSFVGMGGDFKNGCPICHYSDSLKKEAYNTNLVQEPQELSDVKKKQKSKKIFLKFLLLFIVSDIILMWYVTTL